MRATKRSWEVWINLVFPGFDRKWAGSLDFSCFFLTFPVGGTDMINTAEWDKSTLCSLVQCSHGMPGKVWDPLIIGHLWKSPGKWSLDTVEKYFLAVVLTASVFVFSRPDCDYSLLFLLSFSDNISTLKLECQALFRNSRVS